MLGKSLYKLLAKQCNLRKIIIDTTKLMKNSINTSNNVDLIFNTYTFLFLNCCWESWCCWTASTRPCKTSQPDSVDGGNGNGKGLESESLKIRKTTMAPKWLTYSNRTTHQNHGLESRNDEAGIIKRSRGDVWKINNNFKISIWNM